MKYNYNFITIIITIIAIIILYPFINKVLNNLLGIKEGFTWSRDLVTRFNKYQETVNLNDNQFNLKVLQDQASPEETEQLLKTGYWPWSQDTQDQYYEAVWQNPMIKFFPGAALDYAMKLYNETAVKRLMSWNTKEGQFLLYGGKNGDNTVIKCSEDPDKNPVLQKTTFDGYNLWNGYKNTSTTNIKNEDVPKEMPGFSFVKNSCNPCSALNDPADYSCPFKLNVKGDNETSAVWKNLWNI
jgi:hypothetical protein